MKTVITALLLAISPGCAQAIHVETVTPSELNLNADKYDGKIIVVSGYVNIGPESHILYQSEALFNEFRNKMRSGGSGFKVSDYKADCLTIENPGFLSGKSGNVNKRSVILKGKFQKNYLDGQTIDLGACAVSTGFVVTEILKR